MEKSIKWLNVLFALSLFSGILSACGSSSTSSAEPSFDFGGSPADNPTRSTDLKNIDFTGKTITYDVTYSGNGLKSTAILDLDTKALLSETFEGAWKIQYEYNTDEPMEFQIPATITIYGFTSDGKYDKLINTYKISNKSGGTVTYVDATGKSKDIDTVYFILVSS
jgi:hypothetical protein